MEDRFKEFVQAVRTIVASKTGIDPRDLADDFDYSAWWDDDFNEKEVANAAGEAAGTFLYDLGLDKPY